MGIRLSVLLYIFRFGYNPFSGITATSEFAYRRILEKNKLLKGCEEELLIASMLSEDPSDRPSAEMVLETLNRIPIELLPLDSE